MPAPKGYYEDCMIRHVTSLSPGLAHSMCLNNVSFLYATFISFTALFTPFLATILSLGSKKQIFHLLNNSITA